jgi:hypothetical protein
MLRSDATSTRRCGRRRTASTDPSDPHSTRDGSHALPHDPAQGLRPPAAEYHPSLQQRVCPAAVSNSSGETSSDPERHRVSRRRSRAPERDHVSRAPRRGSSTLRQPRGWQMLTGMKVIVTGATGMVGEGVPPYQAGTPCFAPGPPSLEPRPRGSFNSLPSTHPLRRHNKDPSWARCRCARTRSGHK